MTSSLYGVRAEGVHVWQAVKCWSGGVKGIIYFYDGGNMLCDYSLTSAVCCV